VRLVEVGLPLLRLRGGGGGGGGGGGSGSVAALGVRLLGRLGDGDELRGRQRGGCRGRILRCRRGGRRRAALGLLGRVALGRRRARGEHPDALVVRRAQPRQLPLVLAARGGEVARRGGGLLGEALRGGAGRGGAGGREGRA
jgi:hypothetical protein